MQVQTAGLGGFDGASKGSAKNPVKFHQLALQDGSYHLSPHFGPTFEALEQPTRPSSSVVACRLCVRSISMIPFFNL